jgi:hypothetical protein
VEYKCRYRERVDMAHGMSYPRAGKKKSIVFRAGRNCVDFSITRVLSMYEKMSQMRKRLAQSQLDTSRVLIVIDRRQRQKISIISHKNSTRDIFINRKRAVLILASLVGHKWTIFCTS